MKTRIAKSCFLIVSLAFVTAFAVAGVEPSPFITYQGVLRDAADHPLNGGHDMIFRFFDAQAAGSEILVDEHRTAGTGEVLVQSGMFTVALGAGNAYDGSGPGTHASLAELFRDYANVYLQVEIWNTTSAAWETLTPRTRVFSAAFALNADHLDGNDQSFFINASVDQQSKAGSLILAAGGQSHFGLESVGGLGGGYFEDGNASGYSYVGYGDFGLSSYGSFAGGRFEDSNASGRAYLAYGDRGITGYGANAGGYFYDADSSGYGLVGYGEVGIEARGDSGGGYFVDSNTGGKAYIGYSSYGIYASSPVGGYFEDSDASGYAFLGYGDYGVWGLGNTVGGRFHDVDHSGIAWVGYGDRGIWAKGNFAGGTFSHPNNTTFWADVATSTRKIVGTGTVSFVQNHPFETDKVIVYAAPEGDEVATYTRGTARLIDGAAQVSLGQSFRWVTNPDIGLTAHLTPRGAAADLYIESLSTSEMVVRSLDPAADAAFDYIVYGLRLGFEELAIVQNKAKEAFLPTSEAIEKDYADAAELRSHNALERFKGMRAAMGKNELDLANSRSLVAALEQQRAVAMARLAEAPEETIAVRGGAVETAAADPVATLAAPSLPATDAREATATVVESPHDPRVPTPYEIMPASGPIRAGDVLVLDVTQPGAVHASGVAFDRAVAGCAAALDDGVELPTQHAAVGLSGVIVCRADAAFGAIGVGDLLTTSSNPGHAMLADEYAQGAVLGKAVEPLEQGTGLIRVLVILR